MHVAASYVPHAALPPSQHLTEGLQKLRRAHRKRSDLKIDFLGELVNVGRLLLAHKQRYLCHHAAHQPRTVSVLPRLYAMV